MPRYLKNNLIILIGLLYSVNSMSEDMDKYFKKIPVSKLFLECYLDGETIYKNQTEKFSDRVSLKIEDEYTVYIPDNTKHLFHSMVISGGNTIFYFDIFGTNSERFKDGQYIRFDDDEYYASKEDNWRIVTLNVNRHTGLIQYSDYRSKPRRILMTASGKCEKTGNRKF